MQTTVWKFLNRTTGKEIECNDLNYLLLTLEDDYGLSISRQSVSDLILKGKTEVTLQDENGVSNTVVIGEHCPERGIIFKAV